MLFLLEIALTAIAFTRGWKWLALIPLALAMATGFALGFLGTLAGMEMGLMILLGLGIDAVTVITLVIMSSTGRNLEANNSSQSASNSAQSVNSVLQPAHPIIRDSLPDYQSLSS